MTKIINFKINITVIFNILYNVTINTFLINNYYCIDTAHKKQHMTAETDKMKKSLIWLIQHSPFPTRTNAMDTVN